MSESKPLVAVAAQDVPPRAKASILPEPFASKLAKRLKHPLGEVFGLSNFGVNLARILPGGISFFRHAHMRQDEFVYILHGHPTLVTDEGETLLAPGMCAGFKAGTGNAHQLVNRTDGEVTYLEVGDRTAGDSIFYPEDDLKADSSSGQWRFTHKDGTPLE